MEHGNVKDLLRFTVSDKVLRVKPFNIAKNSKYDKYQRDLALMIPIILNNNLFQLTQEQELILILGTNN